MAGQVQLQAVVVFKADAGVAVVELLAVVVFQNHQRQAVVVGKARVRALRALVQLAQRGVDAAGAERAVMPGAEDAVLVVGVEEFLRIGSCVLQFFEVGLVRRDEGAVEVGVWCGVPVDGFFAGVLGAQVFVSGVFVGHGWLTCVKGCCCNGVVATRCFHTPSPALPRYAGEGVRVGACFCTGGL